MSKILNDKYYTPIHIANYCWDKVEEIIGSENISEIIEPSCGNGSFYHHNYFYPHFGFDINPEYNFPQVKQSDFLLEPISYLEGRLIIGNPPYGNHLNLAQKFFKKSIEIADYIAFILPIGQLNNTNSMYQFDLIYSEDIGTNFYTDRQLHCCFNIYKRPLNGELNKKVRIKLNDITIYRQDCKDYQNKDYDIRMCYWGDGTAGKILNKNEKYSAEYKIKVNNNELKDKVIVVLSTFNWDDYLNCIAMKCIRQFHIIDVLKKNIPEIK